MKSISELMSKFVVEGEDDKKEDKERIKERGEIKFTIWEEPDKKVSWINKDNKYQKIEYKYDNKDKGIKIQFLIGMQDNSWKLWCGKIGAISYDDDPYCDLKTDDFAKAIIAALDKTQEILDDVKNDPDNYIQYYISR